MRPAGPGPLISGALVAIVGLTQSALFAYVPVMLTLTGLTAGALAGATGTGMLVSIAAAPAMGWLGDRIGQRRLLAALFAGLLVAQAGTAAVLTGSMLGAITAQACLWLLILCRMAHGMAISGIMPSMQAWICGDSAGEQRLRGLAGLSAGLSAGRLLGPVVVMAGLVLGPAGPVWLLVGLVAATAFGMLLLGGDTRAPAEPPSAGQGTGAHWSSAASLLGFAFVLNAAFGAVHFTFGLLLQARMGVSSVAASNAVGALTLLSGGLMLIVQLRVVPRLAHHRLLALMGGLLGFAGGCGVLVAVSGLAGLGTGLALLAVGMALAVPVYTIALSERTGGGRQGRMAGLLASVHTASYAAGALAGGVAFGHATWIPALGGCAVGLVLLTLAPALGIAPRQRPSGCA